MKCPKCGNQDCSIETNGETWGKEYSLVKGLFSTMLFGPLGSFFGWKGKRRYEVEAHWVCHKCGYKF